MRTKKVNRYWCDFCNKGSLSASAMTKHEKHCTLNPNRECRVCKMVEPGWKADFQVKKIAELVALLPVPVIEKDQYGCNRFQEGFEDAVSNAVPALREAAGNCPACMLAALRQAHIPVPIAQGFNFTNEMKSLWAEINAEKEERYYP